MQYYIHIAPVIEKVDKDAFSPVREAGEQAVLRRFNT